MFRAIWFAYIGLQYLDGDMQCPLCGPSPDTTIWDGVMLAFNQKHLLPSLEPLTAISNQAPVREHTRHVYKQQLLPDKDLRSLVRGIISGPSLLLAGSVSKAFTTNSGGQSPQTSPDNDDENANIGQTIKITIKEKKEDLARIEVIPLACEKLTAIDVGLGELFSKQFGLKALVEKRWGISIYQCFFLQVCPW